MYLSFTLDHGAVLMVARQGAEPVYLHIMRPMIKPYSAPLDSLLEITDTFGDLVVLILAIPYHMVMWVYYRLARKKAPKVEVKVENVCVGRYVRCCCGSARGDVAAAAVLSSTARH